MKVPAQKLIIRAKDMYDYYVKHGNITLYVDPLFNPGKRKIISGDVVAICDLMHPWSTIVPEVVVGDRVYFHYNALAEVNAIPDSDGLWVIEYDFIFCSVRNGKIIPIGGRIFAEPLYDGDIVEVDIGGFTTKAKLTESGLVKEINPGHNLRKAKLAHIGTPRIGDDPVPVKTGDVFYYIENGDFKNSIEGKDYFVMFQDEILAIDQPIN